jgi:putative ABC transport system permease protein
VSTLALAFRFARRELRSGLSGFRIFFLCLALGVAAIAGVESVAEAFLTGLAEQGRTLLGGDVSVGLVHRPADANERAFLARYGRVTESVSMRAMAYAIRNGAEGERQLVELKAIDNAYPLVGQVTLWPARNLHDALACAPENGRTLCGAVVEQTLLDRLGLAPGGTIRIGTEDFRIAAVLVGESDRISTGFSLGPHVLISTAALPGTGLVQLGSLINYTYRVAFRRQVPIADFKAAATAAFPDGGWEIRDRNDAAPGIKQFVEQVTMFLTLVGLTALAVGGVGAGQAVSAFLDRKREEIATLKALGAGGTLIFFTFFIQVMIIALGAILIGLAIGAYIPFAVQSLYGSSIPAPAHFAVYPGPLALAAIFGLFSAIAFAVPPLARARLIAPASLFRDLVAPADTRGAVPYLAAAALAGLVVIALALFLAPAPRFAAEFLGGAIAVLVVLRLVAEALRAILVRLPRPRRPGLRLALANLTRPGATTSSVVTALGLGLTLLATVTLLDRTISAQVADNLPERAPSFYFIDIQLDEAGAFDATVAHFKSASGYRRTPMIRGRITALNGTPARDVKVGSDAKWVLAGDRGLTYAAAPPEGTEITEGKWWPASYQGPTLISFDADLAPAMGLKLGSTITLNVLGREITGTIANLRHVDFKTGQQNFVIILSPGLIDHAPHSFLATVRVAPRDEEALYRAVTDRFQNVSTVRVKDAIAQVDALLQELSDGVRAASLLTIVAGLLVLAGAIAAGGRARLYDATVLKVLGATRARILGVTLIEYGLLGAITGAIALAAGTLAASLVAREILDVRFVFDGKAALLTVIGGGAVTVLFGLAGAWAALSARPARLLRAP